MKADDYNELNPDILILAKLVLNINVINVYTNREDYSQCPFCYEKGNITADMGELNHNVGCGYLLAKDILTNIK